MSSDIDPVLVEWPYDDDGLQVRFIHGTDGRKKIQLRLDLGLLQMDTEGRPDGRRPRGFLSLLDYYRSEAEAYRRRHGWYEGFELDSSECSALRREALQYYHRRISLMALQEYSAAAADADHNLQILDFLKAFARNRDDWLASEQYRAFIVCHKVQCRALEHLLREDPRAAILEVDLGARQLKEIFAEQDRLDEFDESPELEALDDLRRKLEARYQVSRRQRLQILLDDALRREDPDTVASLRAQLRSLESEIPIDD